MNKRAFKEFKTIKSLIAKGEYKKARDELNNAKYLKGNLEFHILQIWIGCSTINKTLIGTGIKKAKKYLNDKNASITSEYEQQAAYNIGNGYSSLLDIEFDKNKNLFSDTYITNLREASSWYKRVDYNHRLFSMSQTNLGNLYDNHGRPLEAIRCYTLALKKNPAHCMAMGNIALAYLYLIPFSKHKGAYSIYAYQLLDKAISNPEEIIAVGGHQVLETFTASHNHIKDGYEKNGDVAALDTDLTHPNRDRSKESLFCEFYNDFCLENDLFLNLHMFDKNSEASLGDDLDMTITSQIYDKGYADDIYFRVNEINESFLTARYLLGQSQYKSDDMRYISEQAILANLTDYSVSNLYVGMLKSSYKEAINTLDKIAVLLSHYLSLGPENKVYYSNVWYKNFDEKQPLNDAIANSTSRHLFGLYMISKEVKKIDSNVRNALTHRYLRVYRTISGPPGTYTFEELSAKTAEILFLVKCAITSLTFFINENESNKSKLYKGKKTGILVEMPVWTDQMLEYW